MRELWLLVRQNRHYALIRFLVALALPRFLGPLRLFLAAPYLKRLTERYAPALDGPARAISLAHREPPAATAERARLDPDVRPRVSVVLATHNRPDRLARQLAALRAQTLPDDQYEIVVVDDGSGPETVELTERERQLPGPSVRVVRQEVRAGAARARNAGWRAARAPLIAFTDDDCRATPGWLEAGLAAWQGEPARFVQGPTRPDPAEAHLSGALAHTLVVEQLGPWWETANMFYPRAALEAVGGFDEDHYSTSGEDTDLGWKALDAGLEPFWASQALMYHAVTRLDAPAKLRLAWRWDQMILVFKRHRALRRELTMGIFWSPNHWWLVRAIVALLVPTRLPLLRWWLAAPYVLRMNTRRPDEAAVLVLYDVVEIAACARGAVRYRVPVL